MINKDQGDEVLPRRRIFEEILNPPSSTPLSTSSYKMVLGHVL
jgi:hypothetical protein